MIETGKLPDGDISDESDSSDEDNDIHRHRATMDFEMNGIFAVLCL